MTRQSAILLEMRHPLPFIIFILSGLLIYTSDFLLIDNLGKNPLETELTFLEKESKRIQTIEKKKLLDSMIDEKKAEPFSRISYFVISGVAILLTAVLFFSAIVLERRVRLEAASLAAAAAARAAAGSGPAAAAGRTAAAAPENFFVSKKGLILANVLLGLLILSFGILYYAQGKTGMAALKNDWDRIATIYANNDRRKPHEVASDDDLIEEYKGDARRHIRGMLFILVGGLTAFCAAVVFQMDGSRSKP